jgi:predicted metalloprotease with PDZ domain
MPPQPFPRRRRATLAALALLFPAAAVRAQQSPPPSATAPVSAPVSDIRYEVTFDAVRGRQRTVGVAMTFTAGGRDPVVLSLPAWTPGAYEISNYARYVIDFAASSGGRALRWDKADHDSWRVFPEGAGAVQVAFTYVARELNNAHSWAQPDFLLFNGTNLFLYPEGRPLDFGATVTVRTQPGWLVATGMKPVRGAAGGGAAGARSYTAPTYHDLVDMPFFVGRFDYDSAMVSGKWFRFATYPSGSVTGARRATAWGWVKQLVPVQAAIFGDSVPWDAYTLLQIADSGFDGISGLEHQNSHVLITTPVALDGPYVATLRSIYSHEFFHAWNVKRLRPAQMVPYRYDAPGPSELLWVSEGITDYYADVAEVRAGTVNAAGFFRLTSGKVQESSDADIPPTALEDASVNAWVSPVDGTGDLYYAKGSVVGLLLDILIRDASDNRGSLDVVMRDLYESTYLRGGRGFTNAELWAAVKRAAGSAEGFDDFYARYVDGRESLPLATVLPLGGMRLVADTTREPRLGVATVGDEKGIMVTDVEAGSAAAAAGVREGDYLISIGDLAVADQNFGVRFRARKYREGQALTLKVRRGEQTLDLPSAVRYGVTRIERRVAADPNATPKAVRVRDGILKGASAR